MYIPKSWHWFITVGIILSGFFIRQRYGNSWDVTLTMFVLWAAAGAHAYWIIKAGLIYQNYQARTELPEKSERQYREEAEDKWREKEAAKHGLTPVPKVNDYRQTLPQVPLFDRERHLAVTLVRQKEQFDEEDMTEETWVKSGRFSRSEFKAILEKWELYGIIERVDARPNATFYVRNWEGLRLIAAGNVLGDN